MHLLEIEAAIFETNWSEIFCNLTKMQTSKWIYLHKTFNLDFYCSFKIVSRLLLASDFLRWLLEEQQITTLIHFPSWKHYVPRTSWGRPEKRPDVLWTSPYGPIGTLWAGWVRAMLYLSTAWYRTENFPALNFGFFLFFQEEEKWNIGLKRVFALREIEQHCSTTE